MNGEIPSDTALVAPGRAPTEIGYRLGPRRQSPHGAMPGGSRGDLDDSETETHAAGHGRRLRLCHALRQAASEKVVDMEFAAAQWLQATFPGSRRSPAADGLRLGKTASRWDCVSFSRNTVRGGFALYRSPDPSPHVAWTANSP